MTAQVANGGYKINPRIIINKENENNKLEKYLLDKRILQKLWLR